MASLDLNLLTTYEAIVRTRSVSRAAQQLGLSKAAISHALARLRRIVGDPILLRSGREWVLSERALLLRDELAGAIGEARRLLAPPPGFVAAESTRAFRLHATDHAISLLGLGLGRAIAHAAPGVSLSFLPILPDDAAALRVGDVDLALGVFPDLPPHFRTQTLFQDRFACVVRRGHPRVRDGRLTLEDFLAMHHVQVAPRGRPGGVLDDVLAARKLRRRVTRQVPYYLVALELASQTDCVVTISERLARAHAARFRIEILKPPLALKPYTLTQVWHPRVDADPAHAWLRRRVMEAAEPLRVALPKL